MASVSFAARKAGWIASGKRFLECFIYFFFHVAVVVVTRFFVRSIRAHGVSSTNPHLFRLQSVCFSKVGRKSRWGEGLGAPKTTFFPTFLHAGFEPRRGRTTSVHFQAISTDDTLDETTCTHGSNPARLRHGW
jgi:hypothetical protein